MRERERKSEANRYDTEKYMNDNEIEKRSRRVVTLRSRGHVRGREA